MRDATNNVAVEWLNEVSFSIDIPSFWAKSQRGTHKGGNMRLENNQQFPNIVARRVQGGEMAIPADLAGNWSVLLFYRGEW